jgi:phosphogluconate dehydratase
MPELHKLTPPLGVLQDRGFKVALLTDGRMSGASGKVPAAIHLTPEAVDGGPIAKIEDGDIIRIDAVAGMVEVLVDEAAFSTRSPVQPDLAANEFGMGRELFSALRQKSGPADEGACVLFG